jgi:uncharacterized protein
MDVRYLILVLTTRCNLRCRYCYHGDGLEPANMSMAVLEKAVGLAATAGSRFHLQLTGGEPTLVPALIEAGADRARKTGRCLTIGIQTNGTCLTRDMLRLFQQYDMQVGVSLDGPPQVHQTQRGMAAETLKGLQLLDSARIPFRVTTVVTQANAARLDELVLILAGYSMARGIGLDLLVRKGRACVPEAVAQTDRATLEAGLQRMRATLDAVNARRAVPIQWREWELLFPADDKQKRRPGFCHSGLGQSLAVTPDGRIFPCAQTLDDPQFAAGTVWQPRDEALTQLKTCRPQPDVCSDCEVHAICPGDCPSRLYYNQSHEPLLACDLYRTLYRMDHGRPSNTTERESLP